VLSVSVVQVCAGWGDGINAHEAGIDAELSEEWTQDVATLDSVSLTVEVAGREQKEESERQKDRAPAWDEHGASRSWAVGIEGHGRSLLPRFYWSREQ
jgi:hypothetical protein